MRPPQSTERVPDQPELQRNLVQEEENLAKKVSGNKPVGKQWFLCGLFQALDPSSCLSFPGRWTVACRMK